MARFIEADLRRLLVLALNGFIDLLAVDGNFRRGIDAQANFVAANIHDGDNNIVADHDAFIAVSRQNQHRWLLLLVTPAGLADGSPPVIRRSR